MMSRSAGPRDVKAAKEAGPSKNSIMSLGTVGASFSCLSTGHDKLLSHFHINATWTSIHNTKFLYLFSNICHWMQDFVDGHDAQCIGASTKEKLTK